MVDPFSLFTFPASLMEEAKKNGWVVISMKNEWARILRLTNNPVTSMKAFFEDDGIGVVR
jgi:hypothetical protein